MCDSALLCKTQHPMDTYTLCRASEEPKTPSQACKSRSPRASERLRRLGPARLPFHRGKGIQTALEWVVGGQGGGLLAPPQNQLCDLARCLVVPKKYLLTE